MTIKRIGGSKTLIPDPHLSTSSVFGPNSIILNATGEAAHFTGQVFLAAGSGSKTISSAGGKIHYRSSSTTFVNASTTLRAGIQDVSTINGPPGRGDGTYDVYGEFVGGTDTISSSRVTAIPMSSGSKTISHGDKVSIALELMSYGGSDSVTVQYVGNAENMCQNPVFASYLSSSWARVSGTPVLFLEFDDGSLGWLFGTVLYETTPTEQSFNLSSSTADEYGVVLSMDCPIACDGAYAYMYPTSASADFEICLYEDPFGTPTLIEAMSCDATAVGTSGGALTYYAMFSQQRTLKQGTKYAITIRPTTAGNVSLYYWDVSMAAMMDVFQLGQDCYAVRRINNTGAFSEWNGGTAKTRRMVMGLCASGFQDAWGEARAQSLIGV